MPHTSPLVRSAPSAAASAAPLLELRDVRVRFGKTEVLRGLDLTAPQGILAVLGANGAGKTTLMRILTTLARQTSGTVRVLGTDVAADPGRVRRMLRLTAQTATVDEVLTGRENLILFGRLLGLSASAARERANDLLGRFGLVDAADRRAAKYSGGMRRRLDLAVGLVDRPRVLILDEPTTGLDPASRAELWDVLRELAATGTSIILTTQVLAEAEALADLVAIMHEGRITATGTPAELADRVGAETIRLRDAEGTVVRAVPSDGTARHMAHLLAALDDDQLGLRVELDRPTLDDAFAHLTGTRTDGRSTDDPLAAHLTSKDLA